MEHIRLQIAPDAPTEKLLLAARLCMERAGIQDGVLPEPLRKARGVYKRRVVPLDYVPPEAPLPDPALDAHWHAMGEWGSRWPSMVEAYLLRMSDPPGQLQKAREWAWHFPLAPSQWDRVRQALARLSSVAIDWLLGRGKIPTQQVPASAFPASLRDSYGHAVRLGMSIYGNQPLTPSEQAAMTYAKAHAGTRLRPIFHGFDNAVEANLLEAEQQAVRTQTVLALGNRHGPDALASAIAQAQQHFARDWQRVARTELLDSYSQGAVAALIARHPQNAEAVAAGRAPSLSGIFAYKIPSVNACLHCKRVWLNADGSPRIYPLEEIVNNPSNVGKPAADWTAQVGALHPNCTEGALQEYTAALEPTFATMRHDSIIG